MSLPLLSSNGKYFWFAFIVRIRHSCGTSRNSASNLPTSTLGRSTSAVTSSSSASSSIGLRFFFGGGSGKLAGDFGAARCEAGDHRAFVFHLRFVAVGILQHYLRHTGLETVTLRFASGIQTQHADRHNLRAMQRDQAMRGAHEIAHCSSRRRVGRSSPWRSAVWQALHPALSASLAPSVDPPSLHAVVEQHFRLSIHLFELASLRYDSVSVRSMLASFFSNAGVACAVRIQPYRDRHQLLRHLRSATVTAHSECAQPNVAGTQSCGR